MLKSRYFIVGEGMSIDQRSNSLSIFNIIEGVNSPQFPIVLPKICLVSHLMKEASDPNNIQGKLRISLNGVEISSSAMNIFFNNLSETRVIMEYAGFVIQQHGVLKFEISYDNNIIAESSIAINQIAINPEIKPNTPIYFPPPPSPSAAAPDKA